MKKLFFYTLIIIFSFTTLFTIFSFRSIDVKKEMDANKVTLSATNKTATENATPAANAEQPATKNNDLVISENMPGEPSELPASIYRPAKELAARALYGVASYYANSFVGQQASNGEIFSQNKLTGASNFLPLNTWVKVTNLKNGKSVVVKITDRMNKRMKRVIDLSKTAAKQLAYTGEGLAQVKVVPIGKNKPAA
jgi:rare lipoprotein A